MSETLYKQIKDYKTDVKDITIDKYFYYLKKLHGDIYNTDNFKTLTWLKDYSEIMDSIKDKNYLSQRNILNAVIVALSSEKGNTKIIDKFSILRNNFNTKYTEDIKTRTNDDIISRDELNSVINNYEKLIKFKKCKSNKLMTKSELGEFQLYVILKFYEKHPLRSDMPTFKFIMDDDEQIPGVNYYIWNKGIIILNDYKTSKKYGTVTIQLEPELNNLLKCLIKKKIDKTNNYLITKQNGKPYSKTEFSNLIIKFFKKKTGKNIGVTALRRIYLQKYTDVKEEMKADAQKMGHSVATQQGVYVSNKD
tara:strand:+ start:582 stop:1502 length:921 start_codon:yes stop_codon:yes gene_type:complete